MKTHRHTRLGAGILALALLAGCGPSAGEPAADVQRDENIYYTLYTDGYRTGSNWVLDQEGRTIAEDEQFITLYDQLTGAAQCKMRHRLEGVDAGEGDGGRTWKDVSALYDLEGNLLHDWADCYYQGGFGDFVIRQSRQLMFYDETVPADYETHLWNYQTGQSHLAEVEHVYPLETGETAVLLNAAYAPLGVVDAAGGILSGFPAPEKYAYITDTWNGYMLASSRPFLGESRVDDRAFLLTADWEELLVRSNMHRDRSGKYLCTENPQIPDAQNLVTADGAVVLSVPSRQYISYFDDEFAIVESGEHDSVTDPFRRRLVRIGDGEVLAENCEELAYAGTYSQDSIAEAFAAYSDGVLRLISREGAIAAEREIADLRYIEYISGGRYRCSLLAEDGHTDTILDSALETVVPPHRYNNVMQASDWHSRKVAYYPIMTAQRKNPNGWQTLTDVLDLQGNVLVEGLNMVYQIGPDRLAVRRGFEMGLMDWQGNWIVSRSIFSDLVDD